MPTEVLKFDFKKCICCNDALFAVRSTIDYFTIQMNAAALDLYMWMTFYYDLPVLYFCQT